MISPSKKLKKDEFSMISKIIWTLTFVLVIIDMIVIIFFLKTTKRLNIITNHKFT